MESDPEKFRDLVLFLGSLTGDQDAAAASDSSDGSSDASSGAGSESDSGSTDSAGGESGSSDSSGG